MDAKIHSLKARIENIVIEGSEADLDRKIAEVERKLKDGEVKKMTHAKDIVSNKAISILGDATNWNMQPLFDKKKYDLSVPITTEVSSILEFDLV